MNATIESAAAGAIPQEGPPLLTLGGVQAALDARVVWCPDLTTEVAGVVAADLMSDVLTGSRPNQVLLTSLVTPLTVRTAAIVDFVAVVFVRGKEPHPDIVALAEDERISLFTTARSTFEAAGALYALVTPPRAGWAPRARLRNTSFVRTYSLGEGGFADAGRVSTTIKDTLKRIGVPPEILRRVAIAAYEAEMNVTMYAHDGVATLRVEREAVELEVHDEGPGIPDTDLALQEGYSTATPEMREMGFGAGMGLPNMKRVSDDFEIDSVVRRGTRLRMRFRLEDPHA
jgi:anti-sigma regulatory factor (Ser/Thr protein kinase)